MDFGIMKWTQFGMEENVSISFVQYFHVNHVVMVKLWF